MECITVCHLTSMPCSLGNGWKRSVGLLAQQDRQDLSSAVWRWSRCTAVAASCSLPAWHQEHLPGTRKKIHRDFLSGVPLRVLYYPSMEGQQWVDFLPNLSHHLLSGNSTHVYSVHHPGEHGPARRRLQANMESFPSVRSRVSWKAKRQWDSVCSEI